LLSLVAKEIKPECAVNSEQTLTGFMLIASFTILPALLINE